MTSPLSPDAPLDIRVARSDAMTRTALVFWAVLVAGLAAAPFWGDRQTLRLLTEIYSYLALASLWNLLAGYAGLVSIGQQAFVGVGGYCLYLCALRLGLNPLFGVPVAGVVGGLFAVPVILLLQRLRGAYFTIGSWVVAEILIQAVQQIPSVGGGSGISLPATVVKAIATTRDGREFSIYWIFLILVVAVIGAIIVLLRSRYGLALTAIRDNEEAAKSNGIDVYATRMVAFIVAGVATATVGSMIFLQKLNITPFSAFSMNDWTVNVIFITVIGGIGRVEGPLFGTVIYFLLREYLADLASAYLIILGVVAIAIMIKAPSGLWGYFADRYGWHLFPLARRLILTTPRVGSERAGAEPAAAARG